MHCITSTADRCISINTLSFLSHQCDMLRPHSDCELTSELSKHNPIIFRWHFATFEQPGNIDEIVDNMKSMIFRKKHGTEGNFLTNYKLQISIC